MTMQDLMEGPLPKKFTAFEPPLEGYYALKGNTVILSLIVSLDEGKANVGNLLKDWMEKYEVIIVPTPSYRMQGICERRGFKWESVFFEDSQDFADCMVWRKT